MVVKKLCPNCGIEIDNDSEFCTSCGTNINKSKLPHFVTSLNNRMNISAIMFTFIVFGILLLLLGLIFSLLVSSGNISFVVYLGLTIIISMFLAGIVLGYIGCNDKKDSIANPSVMLISILAIILPILGVSTTVSIGISAALSSAFGGSTSSSSSLGSSSSSSSSTSILDNMILEIVLIGILTIVALYGGCYLGFYLRENL